MLLTVQRFSLKKDWSLGRFLIDSKLDGFTVEDEVRQVKVMHETAIPYGTYDIGLHASPKFSEAFYWSEEGQVLIHKPFSKAFLNHKFSRETFKKYKDWKPHFLFEVKSVANFRYVLLHWGNTDLDSSGCIILGRSLGVLNGREAVLYSKAYYLEVYPKIMAGFKEGGIKIKIEQA